MYFFNYVFLNKNVNSLIIIYYKMTLKKAVYDLKMFNLITVNRNLYKSFVTN